MRFAYILVLFLIALPLFCIAQPVAARVDSTLSLGNREAILDAAPVFPGGEAALFSYLKKELKYPKKAMKANTVGIIYIEFIVEKNGSVSSAQVVKGFTDDDYCRKEALRIVNKMPRWQPGLKNGEPVRVTYSLPVRFSMN